MKQTAQPAVAISSGYHRRRTPDEGNLPCTAAFVGLPEAGFRKPSQDTGFPRKSDEISGGERVIEPKSIDSQCRGFHAVSA
jgi:hypothetical protein